MNNRKRETLLQNQDLLTDRFIVGIDPSKKKLEAQITDHTGRPVGNSFTIASSIEGFHRVFFKQIPARLPELSREQYRDRLVFAIESSCNLWQQFHQYVKEQHCIAVLVSPLATHHGRPSLSGDFSANDSKDALVIAELASRGNYFVLREGDPNAEAMKLLSIEYEKTLSSLQQHKLRLTSQLDLIFPDFRDYLPIDSATARYLLKNYVLASDYAAMDIEKEAAHIWEVSKGHFGRSLLEKLQREGSKSVGLNRVEEAKDVQKMICKNLLLIVECIEKSLQEIREKIISLSKQKSYHSSIRSLKGIGDLEAAIYIAELIDPGFFSHFRQIERLAGYQLQSYDSGTYRGLRRISHIGNRRLRRILYLMVTEAVKYIPEIRAKYLRRQLAGCLCRKMNLIACIPKLLQLLVALCRDGRTYIPDEKAIIEVARLEKEVDKMKERKKMKARHSRKFTTASA